MIAVANGIQHGRFDAALDIRNMLLDKFMSLGNVLSLAHVDLDACYMMVFLPVAFTSSFLPVALLSLCVLDEDLTPVLTDALSCLPVVGSIGGHSFLPDSFV